MLLALIILWILAIVGVVWFFNLWNKAARKDMDERHKKG